MSEANQHRTDRFNLSHGVMVLHFPAVITATDMVDIREYLAIRIRTMEKMAERLSSTSPKPTTEATPSGTPDTDRRE